MSGEVRRHTQSLKTRIPAMLFGWDVLALMLVLALVGILFQRLLQPLMIDSALAELTERHHRIEAQLEEGLAYLEEKELIPYGVGARLVLETITEEARGELISGRGTAGVYRSLRVPPEVELQSYGRTGEGRLRFLSAEGVERFDRLPPFAGESSGDPLLLRFEREGVPMIGTLSISEKGLRRGLQREAQQREPVVLLAADREDEFFLQIRRARTVFWLLFTAVLSAILAVKLLETRRVARELQRIGGEILLHSEQLMNGERIGSRLRDLELTFRDTEEVYRSFGRLNEGLQRVGSVLGGIADPDLYVATLTGDSSLLDPHEVEMAVLYLDVEGFTTISETYREESMTIINRLWDTVEAAVDRGGGKINKFIGDACISVFFDDDRQACTRALQAAIDILASTQPLRQELGIDFSFRLGLDYGTVTYGKTGSANNYELGVIGDPVNTAARLEELNKQYGTKILLTEAVSEHSDFDPEAEIRSNGSPRVRFFRIDYVRPKGKRLAHYIFTLQDLREEGIALLGDTRRYPESYYTAFSRLADGFRRAVVLWKDGSREDAERVWRRLAVKFGTLSGRYGFPPALPYLRSLLTTEELLRYEEDPESWAASASVRVRTPDPEWIGFGARELEK